MLSCKTPEYSSRMKSALVVSFVIAGAAMAQESLRPVPAEWLHGNRLEVSDLNFSIETPAGRNWSYQKGDKATTFMAIDDEGTRYIIGVLDRSSTALRPQDKDSFLRGMSKTLPAGWQIVDSQFQDSNVPLPGSMSFTVRLRLPDNRIGYQHGYGAPGRRTYMFSAFTAEETAPQSFVAFTSSFHVINAEANKYQRASLLGADSVMPAAMVGGYIVLMLLVAGVCGLVNQGKGRQVVNSFAVAGWVVAIAGLVHLAGLVVFLVRNNVAEPEKAGESVGRVFGAVLIPLIIAFLLAKRTRRTVAS